MIAKRQDRLAQTWQKLRKAIERKPSTNNRYVDYKCPCSECRGRAVRISGAYNR